MNKVQWFVSGIVFTLFSGYLFTMSSGLGLCSSYTGDMITSCMVRRYAYAIPAMIFQVLAWLFIIFGFLEKEK